MPVNLTEVADETTCMRTKLMLPKGCPINGLQWAKLGSST